ncbi:hypothetical protein Pse7367_1667 [Thalassoporum mexicanum PCC 7367]|nr:hypothetical protein Pse7367_1667 [Pseudanabaena sp. PCC 7367]
MIGRTLAKELSQSQIKHQIYCGGLLLPLILVVNETIEPIEPTFRAYKTKLIN